jgi:hypothetical protein
LGLPAPALEPPQLDFASSKFSCSICSNPLRVFVVLLFYNS